MAGGQKTFYETYWSKRGGWGYKPRHEIFARWIGNDARVLDVGCGDCCFLEYLKKRNKNIEAIGTDIADNSVSVCKNQSIEAFQHDATKPFALKDKSFNYVVISETLEHIPNPEELLLEARRIARKAVLVSIPNIALWKHRVRLMFGGRFPKQWALEPMEHLRFFSIKDFRDAVRKLGFKVREQVSSSGTRILKHLWPNLFADQTCFYLEA